MKKSELLEAIRKIYDSKENGGRGTEFELGCYGNIIILTISQMYEYVSFDFETMAAIVEIFSTRKINVGQNQSLGCDTCDYGSSYEVTFSILDCPLEIDWKN